MKKWLSVTMIVWMVSILATVSVGAQASKKAEPIRVGVIQGLTAAHAFYGVPMLKGHNFARDEINAAGGVLGRQIEYVVRDHKGTSAEATRVAKELILNEKVHFLLGTVNSPCGFAISQVAKEYKVLYLDGAIKSAQHSIESGHRYLFAFAVNDIYDGGVMALFESKNQYKNYWGIGWDYAYAHNVHNSFVKKLKEVKPDAKIVGESWLKPGDTELAPLVTSILSSNADAIFSVLQGVSLTSFFKHGKPYGLFEKLHIACSATMGHQEVLESMGKDVPDGILFDGFYWQGYPDTPYNREFVKRYLNRTGDPFVPGIAHHGYVVSTVLFDAIKKARTIDTEKVIDVLENMTFDTPLASGIKFRKIDHNSTIGEVFGVSKYDPNLGYSVLTNLQYITKGEGLVATEQEVKERRAKVGNTWLGGK